MVMSMLGFGALALGAVLFARKLTAKRTSQSPAIDVEVTSPHSNLPQSDTLPPAQGASSELISRLESSFRDVYLQLLTIIQGFAFGFLATTTLAAANSLTLPKWLTLTTCLLIILVIWQDYMVGATAFAWIPTLLDTIIPYGLGLAQFALITFAVDSARNFLLALAITYVLGIIAWGNFCFHAQRGLSINATSYVFLGRYGWFGLYACIAGVVVVGTLYTLSLAYNSSRLESIFAACTLATIAPMFVRSIWHWNLPLRRVMDPS